jgi:hypothetical protein
MAARWRGWQYGRLGRSAAIALLAILAGSGAAAQPGGPPPSDSGWRIFRDRALGFAFAYPAGWVTTPGCHGSRSCIAVSDGRRGVNRYTLALEVFTGGLDQTSAGKAVFHQGPRGWIASGRYASLPADQIAGDGWRGLQAVVDCGISDQSGEHAAAGECLWAVLSNGRISVVADTQGSSPITDEVRRIIHSVRFLRP